MLLYHLDPLLERVMPGWPPVVGTIGSFVSPSWGTLSAPWLVAGRSLSPPPFAIRGSGSTLADRFIFSPLAAAIFFGSSAPRLLGMYAFCPRVDGSYGGGGRTLWTRIVGHPVWHYLTQRGFPPPLLSSWRVRLMVSGVSGLRSRPLGD